MVRFDDNGEIFFHVTWILYIGDACAKVSNQIDCGRHHRDEIHQTSEKRRKKRNTIMILEDIGNRVEKLYNNENSRGKVVDYRNLKAKVLDFLSDRLCLKNAFYPGISEISIPHSDHKLLLVHAKLTFPTKMYAKFIFARKANERFVA